MPYTYEYTPPAVTADVALFTLRARGLAVLLVKRAKAPIKGAWALPGGFVDKNEPLDRAASRELAEETGVTGVALEQLGAFGDPGRDPRGHTVSVAFVSFAAAEGPVRAGDDAADAAFVPLTRLPVTPADGRRARPSKKNPAIELAFDHARIIEVARGRLQHLLDDPRRPAQFEIVPPQFTLTELQHVYEAVLGRELDKRNFRARLFAFDLVEEVGEHRRGRHRPAQLFRWKV